MGEKYAKIGFNWWLSSPYGYYTDSGLMIRSTSNVGKINYERTYNSQSVRPVISLASSSQFTSGDGGYDTPYLME